VCEELGLSEIAAKLSKFPPSVNFNEAEDADPRRRIAALEESANQYDHVIVILHDNVTQLSTDFLHLVREISALRSAAAPIQTLANRISALERQIAQKPSHAVVEEF
jgi:hypothetical protein